MTFTDQHLDEAIRILQQLDRDAIERMVSLLASVRARGGRLFFLGVGGGAGNCGHAVNDFRKLAGFEAYAPSDNVSELTARAKANRDHRVILRRTAKKRSGGRAR